MTAISLQNYYPRVDLKVKGNLRDLEVDGGIIQI